MFKNLLKKKWFWLVVIVVIVAVILIVKSKQVPTITYTTEAVKLGNLSQTVSATGEVESATETNLAFKVSSKLAALPVVVGQKVKAGQVLARLEAGRAASAVNQYRAAVLSAQANLDKIKAGASPEDVAVTEQSVTQAQAALDNAVKIRDQAMVNLRETLLQKMQNGVSDMDSTVKKVKDLILDTSYAQGLGNLNIQMFYDSRNQLSTAQDRVMAASALYEQALTSQNQTDLMSLANSLLDNLTVAKILADKTYQLLLNTTASGVISQSTIDSQKTIMAAAQASIFADISALQTAKDNLTNQTLSYEKSVTDATQALAVAQAQFNLKTAQPRDFDVQYYEAALLQAQANLQAVLSDLSDYVLIAPQDGVITKVNNKLGEQATPGQAVVSMIAESNLQIKMDVPESDIAKVKVGNEASITLDAFGPDRNFAGHVIFVDPAATPKQDVVYYQVTVSFDNNETDVKSGMTANVILGTAQKENVLLIPARSLSENSQGQKIVKILVNNEPIEKPVTIGLRGDEGFVEVTSGLEVGQQVITFIKDASKK